MKRTVYVVKAKKDELLGGQTPIQTAFGAMIEADRILRETMEPAIITELVVENDKIVSHRKVKLSVKVEEI